jgi:phosphonate transport system substrate-binding protein
MSARAFSACVAVTLVVVFVTFATGFRAPPAAREATAATTAASPDRAERARDERFGTDYRLGVFPFLPALTLDRVFAPVIADLGSALGRTVHFRTKPNFEGFAGALADGTYDFIFVHPFFYVTAADKFGYVPMARLRDPLAVAVLVREDSAIQNIGDMAGRTLGLPPKLAAVSEIMLGELESRGMAPGRDLPIRHFQSKMSCLHAVVMGSIDACGLPRFALSHLELGRSERLRVVHESAPYPSLVFAAHPRVPAADRERLQTRILGWETSSSGGALLAAGKWSGFVAARNEDYDPIRRLDRERRKFSERQ